MLHRFLSCILLLPSCLCGGESAVPAAKDSRPNIIFAFADDWGRYASIYRDPARPTLNDLISTPNFDRLARAGVFFRDAHASAPSCTPSRGAVMTGRHFYRNGSASQLHHPWPKNTPDPLSGIQSYLTLLGEAGYQVGVSYKTHVPPHLYGGEKYTHHPAGTLGGAYNKVSKMLGDSTDLKSTRAQVNGEVRQNLASLIDDAAVAKKPFCWWYSPVLCHREWPSGIAQKLHGLDPGTLRGKMPAFLPDVPEVRQDMADYLALCMEFDASLGEIIAELEKRDMLANTLVVVSGDHGVPGFPRGKCNLYDFGTQVPLLLHWPDETRSPGRSIDNPTSLIHLAPTFLAAAGLPSPATVDGVSLLPALRNPEAKGNTPLLPAQVVTGRELHVRDARENDMPYPCRALRSDGFLYIRNFKPERWPVATPPLQALNQSDIDRGPARSWFARHFSDSSQATQMELNFGKRPAEELYELASDPDQMHNLASDPTHAATREKLSSQLLKILQETGDPRVIGEGDAFDRFPYHRPPAPKGSKPTAKPEN